MAQGFSTGQNSAQASRLRALNDAASGSLRSSCIEVVCLLQVQTTLIQL